LKIAEQRLYCREAEKELTQSGKDAKSQSDFHPFGRIRFSCLATLKDLAYLALWRFKVLKSLRPLRLSEASLWDCG
jgi:hypothetical protein